MRAYRRFSTVWQMAAAVFAFVVVGVVIESGGLVDWAERLDLGPERTVALPIVTALHDRLQRLGVEPMRRKALVGLARAGWSDDPVALAEAHPRPVAPTPSAPPPPAVLAPAPSALAPAPSAPPADTTDATTEPAAPAPPPVVPVPPKPSPANPPRMSRLPAMAAIPPGTKRTVALAGDSMMAVGLSSTILRQAPQYKDLVLLKAFKSGTGLARPEVFDWQTEYPAMLAGAKPDVVLVAIGANDGQGFVDGGVTYPFGTTGWQAIYKARVQAYLNLLEADGATVVWLGLPPMKNESYDARTALVNRIDYAVVSASPHAIWFSTTGLYADASGKFLDFGPVRGVPARLRQEDGIHISDAGGVLVADALLPWLSGK